MAVAASWFASLSAIVLAPMGYPHNKLVKKTLSQLIPNNNLESERFRGGCTFRVSVVSTIKGNSAGNTLNAHIVMPSTKLCMYFVGAVIKINTVAVNSSVDSKRKCFTFLFYLGIERFMRLYSQFDFEVGRTIAIFVILYNTITVIASKISKKCSNMPKMNYKCN